MPSDCPQPVELFARPFCSKLLTHYETAIKMFKLVDRVAFNVIDQRKSSVSVAEINSKSSASAKRIIARQTNASADDNLCLPGSARKER